MIRRRRSGQQRPAIAPIPPPSNKIPKPPPAPRETEQVIVGRFDLDDLVAEVGRRQGWNDDWIERVTRLEAANYRLLAEKEALGHDRDHYWNLVNGFVRSSGPYRIYHWTDDLRHADECDCDLDDEYIGDRCMANSDWTYGVCDDGGSLPPRLIVKLPRHLPESCGECDAVPLLTVPGCDHG